MIREPQPLPKNLGRLPTNAGHGPLARSDAGSACDHLERSSRESGLCLPESDRVTHFGNQLPPVIAGVPLFEIDHVLDACRLIVGVGLFKRQRSESDYRRKRLFATRLTTDPVGPP